MCWPQFGHAGFAEATTEANKTNKEIKLKKLKVERVPCHRILIISFVWDTNMVAMSIVFCVSWECENQPFCPT